MKSTLSLLILLMAFSLQAQKITVNPAHVIESYENVDITNNDLDLENHISISNNTQDSIQLIWKRIETQDCPEEWQTQICDNNKCYYFTINSNVDEENGINKPFTLQLDETFNDFILHVFPRTVAGCCRVKVEFSTVQEPDVLLETAVFDISTNTPNCNFGTSVQEIEEAKLVNVFPNPTSESFTLSNNDVIDQIDLYNNLGQKLKTFQFENGEYFNVTDLKAGIYSLVLKNKDGLTLHSLMLNRS